ncbi:MAG: hybrid sensor histidine kinase/response regulator [Candidatus Kapaibacterium sp.]|nr:MAG: hybrid sensor histidine kinase/response regulator [Candidatus Kapabacteria bacterium]
MRKSEICSLKAAQADASTIASTTALDFSSDTERTVSVFSNALHMKLNFTTSSKTPQNQAPETAKRRLLIVDDEQMLLFVLSDIFKNIYDLKTADSGETALTLIAEDWQPEVIIADQRMTGMSGAQFLAKSIALSPKAVRVILTGYTDVQDIIDSINLGNVYRFLTKPWQRDELLEAVRLCFEHYDVTTRNAELAASLQKVRELSEEKDELLGIVAHDLKNPLQAIREFAELCNDDPEMELAMRQSMLSSIVRTSNRMFAIIRNLLDINALERGAIQFMPVSIPLSTVLDHVVNTYRARAEAKNITLHYASSKTARLYADESWTIQVFDNLISNAVKYSPHGKNIFVSIAENASNTALRVEIRDEGPGISETDMKKLFGKFARLSAQPTGKEDSTGLGLSIVKKIVEGMNGKVWCESELGKGASFFAELPTKAT